jgi:hypothetical protein
MLSDDGLRLKETFLEATPNRRLNVMVVHPSSDRGIRQPDQAALAETEAGLNVESYLRGSHEVRLITRTGAGCDATQADDNSFGRAASEQCCDLVFKPVQRNAARRVKVHDRAATSIREPHNIGNGIVQCYANNHMARLMEAHDIPQSRRKDRSVSC